MLRCERDERRGTPMDFFSVPREHPLSPHPFSGRDVLRAAATLDGEPKVGKKIQPPICKVGGLFNCDIQFLLVIHLFFLSLPLSLLSVSFFLSLVPLIRGFRGVEMAHKGCSLINLPRRFFSFSFSTTPRCDVASLGRIIMRLIRTTHFVH